MEASDTLADMEFEAFNKHSGGLTTCTIPLFLSILLLFTSIRFEIQRGGFLLE